LSNKEHPLLLTEEARREEIVGFCKRVIEMTALFEEKYDNAPRLICATCKNETMTHGDVLGLLCMHSINFAGDQNKLYRARKLIYEAFEIFPQKELDELVTFMAQAVNALAISCPQCDGEHWDII
jgi:hypothetical protein